MNAQLYANESDFNDITSGNNGAFSAAIGWDACTGLGSPQGTALLSTLSGAAPTPTPTPAPAATYENWLNALAAWIAANPATPDTSTEIVEVDDTGEDI